MSGHLAKFSVWLFSFCLNISILAGVVWLVIDGGHRWYGMLNSVCLNGVVRDNWREVLPTNLIPFGVPGRSVQTTD